MFGIALNYIQTNNFFITSSFHNVNNFYSLRQHALYNAVDRLSFSLIDACKKRSEKDLLDVFILYTDPCCAVFTTVKQYSCSLPFV